MGCVPQQGHQCSDYTVTRPVWQAGRTVCLPNSTRLSRHTTHLPWT